MSGKNPRHLFVYFKKWLVPSDQIDSDILKVAELENKIKTDEQIFIKFKEIPELCLSVSTQIDLLIKEFEKEIGVIPVEFTSIEKEVLQLPININENKFDKNMVEDLARRCGLFTPWKVNRHLTFESGDISYFAGMNFSPFELEVKFRARKLILEKADELGIRLDEPGDLSEKSKRIESLLIDYWKAKNK
jgi:hypothetical protein